MGERSSEEGSNFGLQFLVFFLVSAAFSTIYITQPVLPVLRAEFNADETRTSFTISAVILGIALANLPFGTLADRYPIRPIILVGGSVVTACGFLCAVTPDLETLIVVRFIQGLFIPSLTTCLAAYLAKSLPPERLNVVMGSYVSATVAGGLGGRLLGGWIHPPLHWRFAFVSASVLLLAATAATVRWLPREKNDVASEPGAMGFVQLLSQPALLRMYLAAFGAFFVFSSVFNYLPFYLSGPPFHARTEVITLMYLAYVIGIVMGPLAGKLSNRIGNGSTMAIGAVVFGSFIALTLIQSMLAVAASLAGICAGFFAVHSAAAGSLNRKLTSSRGRANSLYVLFYYLGGAVGITLSGYAHRLAGWPGVAALGGAVLLVPLVIGLVEMTKENI
jgi:MFS transporter, YNFM family, putative membrane transport protein